MNENEIQFIVSSFIVSVEVLANSISDNRRVSIVDYGYRTIHEKDSDMRRDLK